MKFVDKVKGHYLALSKKTKVSIASVLACSLLIGGYVIGNKIGSKVGYNEGHNDGMVEGYLNGKSEGMQMIFYLVPGSEEKFERSLEVLINKFVIETINSK